MAYDWQKLKRQKLLFGKSHIHYIPFSIFQILSKPHMYYQLYIKHTSNIRSDATCVSNFMSCIFFFFFILTNKISFSIGSLIYYKIFRNITHSFVSSLLYILQFDKYIFSFQIYKLFHSLFFPLLLWYLLICSGDYFNKCIVQDNVFKSKKFKKSQKKVQGAWSEPCKLWKK